MTTAYSKLCRFLCLAAASAVSASLGAQDLTKEITVDHEIVPQHRDAVMPRLLPSASLTPLKARPLEIVSTGVAVGVDPSEALMPPGALSDTLRRSSRRGYLSAGYFPVYNAGVAAGYRIVDTDPTRLSAWLQFDGFSYSRALRCRNSSASPSPTLSDNAVTAGIDFSHRFASDHILEARLAYLFRSLDTRLENIWQTPAINGNTHDDPDLIEGKRVNRAIARIGWKRLAATSLHASATYSFFGNSVASPEPSSVWLPLKDAGGNREHLFAFNAGITRRISETQSAGLDLSLSVVGNSRGYDIAPYALGRVPAYQLADPDGSYSHGLLTLRPAYSFGSGGFTAELAAKVELTFNSGKAFHIAPDVTIGWRPVGMLALQLHAGGGEWQNTAARVFAADPHTAPYMSYRNSHLPITADAAITVGPVKGFAIEISGAYAKANEWLMPALNGNAPMFRPVDISGYRWGVALTYSNSRWADARVSYEATPDNSYDRAWFEWTDRARRVVTASCTVRPVEPLSIDISWNLRTGRKIIDNLVELGSDPGSMTLAGDELSLSTASSFDLGANWNFSPSLSIFARGENLFARRWTLVSFLPSQGVHGLAGVTLRF